MKKFTALVILLAMAFACQSDDDHTTPSNKRNTGSSAAEFLQSGSFKSVEIEILYDAGFEPPASSIEALKNFINRYCHKPGGISVVSSAMSRPAQATYTLDQVVDVEDGNRSSFNSGDKLSLYIYFAGGNYSEDQGNSATLGLAYYNTSIVIFAKTIDENTGGVGNPSVSQMTTAILEHEMGHLLGLVSLGSSMVDDHEDPNNSGHCDNEDCLMYFALNGLTNMNFFMNNSLELDANCEADLRANGGK